MRAIGTFLIAAMLAGCSTEKKPTIYCDEPTYDDAPKATQKWTMGQWNAQRFACINHFARFYARGPDSAESIGEVVASFDCRLPILRTAEAALQEDNHVVNEQDLFRDTRLDAMEEVLLWRSRGCPTGGK